MDKITRIKKRKSNSLWALVSDDPYTPDNVKRFKEHLNCGANLSFRNPAMDDDTPLHQAVENENLEWTRLLIEHGADKSITNRLGKSPLDIATERKLTDIISLLSSQPCDGFRRIEEKNIFEVDFKNTEMLLQRSFDDQQKKILKISKCANFDQAARFMTETSFCQTFNNAPFLFIIIVQVETIDVCDFNLSRYGLDSCFQNPVIIQITSTECSLLYFKESFGDEFKKLSIDDSSNTIDIEWDISEKEQDLSFESLVILQHMNSKHYGKFSYDLERTEVNVDPSLNGARLIDFAVETDNILCLKFLQLFNFDLFELNENGSRTLEIAAQCGTLAGIKILFDIPIDCSFDVESFIPSRKQYELLNLGDQDGNSLLMIAAASGQAEIIRFLIHCELKVDHINENKENASDVAFVANQYGALVELINADARFPNNFRGTHLDTGTAELVDFDRLIQQRNSFHDQIRNQETKEVIKFVQDNPRVKCAYDSANKSALITALESKNLETYSFLRSKGFSHGDDFTNYGFANLLTGAQRKELRACNEKYFRKADNVYIMDLLEKSRLGFGCEQKNFGRIKMIYEALDEIAELQPILKTVANDKNAKIIFDFNRGSVDDMDPLKSVGVKGTTYFKTGQIYIGAKRDSEPDVWGTLAHELTHYVMQLTYNNDCKPYQADDEKKREAYDKIFNEYKDEKVYSKERLIGLAFMVNSDDGKKVELIVRVPHLLALYKDNADKIEELKAMFPDLFNFFIDVTLKDLENEYPVMKAQRKIKELNRLMGNFGDIVESKIYCCEGKMKLENLFTQEKLIFISSQVPKVEIANIYQHLKCKNVKNIDSFHIFVQIEQLINNNFSEMIQESFESEVLPTVFVVDSSKILEVEKFKEILKERQIQNRLVLITSSESSSLLGDVFEEFPCVDHEWNDLHENSKDILLRNKMNFQETDISVQEMISNVPEILEKLSLRDILQLDQSTIKSFNDELSSSFKTSFYIERNFSKQVQQKEIKLTLDQLLVEGESNGIVILADIAGMGKSTTMSEIASRLKTRKPSHWVSFVDLKKHTNEYVKDFDTKLQTVEINHEFISRTLLKIEGNLEQKLFEVFCQSGKCIFLLDGFDEISPNFKTFVLHLIKYIGKRCKNQLWISTRLQHSSELEYELREISIKLQPLTFDCQTEFLIKFWIAEGLTDETLKLKANDLLEKFEISVGGQSNNDFFGTPLHVRMLSSIHDKLNIDESSFNLFKFYKIFIDETIKIWIKFKGPLAVDESTKIHLSETNVMQILQFAALQHIFGEAVVKQFDFQNLTEYLKPDLGSRFGIFLVRESYQIEFAHQTFAEFLVADFLSSQRATRNYAKPLSSLLLNILLKEKYEKIRKFFNDKLEVADFDNVETFDKLSRHMEESFECDGNLLILNFAITEGCTSLLKFLLSKLNFSCETKMKLFRHRNKHRDMALHVAADGGSVELFKCLWSCIANFAQDVELQKSFWLNKGKAEMNVVHRAISEKNLVLLRFILNLAEQIFDASEFKFLILDKNSSEDISLHRAMVCQNEDVFETIWSFVSRILNVEDQKELLCQKGIFGENVLIRSIRNHNRNVVSSILNELKKLYNPDDLKAFLFMESSHGANALYAAARSGTNEIFVALWKFIFENFKEEDWKNWLQELLSKSEKPFLSEAVKNEDKTALETAVKYSKELFDVIGFKTCLIQTNYVGDTAMHLTVEHGKVESLRFLWESFFVLSNPIEQKNLLFDIALKVMKVQSEDKKQKFSEIILELSKNLLSDDEKLLIFDYERLESCTNFRAIDNIVLNALELDLSKDQLNVVFNKKIKSGDTAFHITVKFETARSVDKLLKTIVEKFTHGEQKAFFSAKGASATNIFMYAALNCDVLVIRCVWETAIKLFCPDDIKTLLCDTDCYGNNVFHLAAIYNNPFVLNILEWFKDHSDKEDLLILFRKENQYLTILLQSVAQYCDKHFIERFFTFMNKNFHLSEIKEMISRKGNTGYNSLGRLVGNKFEHSVEAFWCNVKSLCSPDELELLVFEKNDNGKMAFEYGATRIKRNVDKFRNLCVQSGMGRKISNFIKD